jgi:hypothetical protein
LSDVKSCHVICLSLQSEPAHPNTACNYRPQFLYFFTAVQRTMCHHAWLTTRTVNMGRICTTTTLYILCRLCTLPSVVLDSASRLFWLFTNTTWPFLVFVLPCNLNPASRAYQLSPKLERMAAVAERRPPFLGCGYIRVGVFKSPLRALEHHHSAIAASFHPHHPISQHI